MIGLFLILINSLFAQNPTFPVNIAGQLIPPNSLRIGDYFDERTNDLMFVVALNDPIEPVRQVRLRMFVESNGGTILASPPNFQPEILTLEMGFPITLTGDDLVPYFQSLQAVQGNGVPLFLLPGLNGFCIEVIDIATNKIISNKGCANGFFNLAQPPLLQSPNCGIEIEQSETQNILFNWLPMHNASGNPISLVQYDFQIVEVPEGFQNPKDAFDAGMYLFQTEILNMTSINYSDSEPLLEQGKNYAWRVRANALTMDGDIVPLFANNGYSEICTFSYLEPTLPPDPIDFSSCTGSPCAFSGSIDTEPKGDGFFPEDMVKLGFFDLKFTEVSYDDGDESYSGTGTIFVDFLFTNIAVEFFDIKINSADRVFSGEVKAIIEDESVLPADFVGDFNVMNANNATDLQFSNDEANTLITYFDNNITKLTSQLIQSGAGATSSLPVGLNVTSNETGLDHVIAIADIKFTASNAVLNAVYALKASDDSWAKFGAKGVRFRAKGLVDQLPELFLTEDFELETNGGFPIVVETSNDFGTGTSINWNCDGFEKFKLQGRHEFNSQYVVAAEGDDPLTAHFTTEGINLLNFTADVEIPDFKIPELGDFTFNVSQASVDFSADNNLENIEFPDGYSNTENNWEGFYFTDMSVNLPNLFGNNLADLPQLNGTSLIFDTKGLTGTLSAADILSFDDLNIGGWPFQIDLFSLVFKDNGLMDSGIDGKCRLPFMFEGESIPFTGIMAAVEDPVTGDNGWDFSLNVLPEVVSISLLRADFSFNENSAITIPYVDGSFGYPKADFSGSFSFNIGEADIGFDADFMTLVGNLQNFLNSAGIDDLSPNLSLGSISFENMIFDWNASPKFSFGSINPNDTGLNFLGIDCNLSELSWGEIGLDVNGLPRMGFSFDIDFAADILGNLVPDLDFDMAFNFNQSSSPNNNPGSFFNFSDFDMDFGLPSIDLPTFDFSCGEGTPEIDLSNTTSIENLDALSALKIGVFDLTNFENIVKDEAGRFSGIGKIEVPALGPFSNLSVEFQGVAINEVGQIIDGTVNTVVDEAFASGGVAGNLLSAVQDKIANVSGAVGELFQLPIVLGVKADGELDRDQGLIITGFAFGPESAILDAKVIVPLGNDNYAEFIASGLEIVPDGVAGVDLILGLSNDFLIDEIPGEAPLNVKKYNEDGTGSFVKLDCGGFVEFNLNGTYDLPQSQFVNLQDETAPVNLGFTINTQEWGEFIGTTSSMDAFAIAGLPDFKFAVSEGIIDYSEIRNGNDMEFPEGYSNIGFDWQGLLMPSVEVEIPSSFVSGSEPVKFSAENLLVDVSGVTAKLIGTNVLNLSTGSLGNWNYSLDTFALAIGANELVDGHFSGGMQLPIMTEEEYLPYKGSFVPINNGEDLDINFVASPETVTVSLLRSKFTFEENSVITVDRQNGAFQTPKVDLTGMIEFGIVETDSEFDAEINAVLEELESAFAVLGDLVPNLASEGIAFQNLKFDMSAANVFSIGGLEPQNTSIGFMGSTADLSDIVFEEYEIGAEDIARGVAENERLLGFEFQTKIGVEVLGSYAPTVDFRLKIKENPVVDGNTSYSFYEYDLDYEFSDLMEVNVACQSNLPELEIDETPFSGNYSEATIKAGYFNIDELNLTNDDGSGKLSGTGRVTIPVLGPMQYLNVSFTNITVNENGQLMSGEIITESDSGDLFNSPDVNGILGSATDKLSSAANSVVSLPVIMGDEDNGMTIVGLVFKPTEATVQSKIIVSAGGDNYAQFVAEGLTIVPDGIASASGILKLIDDVDMSEMIGYPVQFNKFIEEGNGSYATCDCDGFQGFTLSGTYTFPENQFVNLVNENEPLSVTLTINSGGWGDFTGVIGDMPKFGIPGLDGFAFNIPNGIFDFSTSVNLPSIQLPEGYPEIDVDWQGFFIPDVNIEIPDFFGDIDGISFDGSGLLIDEFGLSGDFSGFDLFDISTGSIGGWGFGMDSLELKFWQGELSLGNFSGGLQIPIMSGLEMLPLIGWFDKDFNFTFNVQPIDIPIDLFRSTFNFGPTSTINIDFLDGAFSMPRLNLDGFFTFNVGESDPGMDTDFMSLLDGLGGILGDYTPNFDFEGIKFTGMSFDWNAEPKFSIGSFDPMGVNMDFLGMDFDLSGIQFLKMPSGGDNSWGLNFNVTPDIGFALPDLTFSLNLGDLFSGNGGNSNGNNNNSNGSGSWFEFSGFDLNYGSGLSLPSFDFSCADGGGDVDLSNTVALADIVNIPKLDGIPTIKVGFFNMTNLEDFVKDNATGKFSGIGKIDVEALGPFAGLAVDFQDVVINEVGQIIEGQVNTKIEGVLDNLGDGLPNPNDLLSSVQGKINNIANSVGEFFELPIVIGVNADGETEKDQGLIITGLQFGPEKAIVDAQVVIPVGSNYIEFSASGLEIVPNGIAGFELVLGLVNDFEMPAVPGMEALVFEGYNREEESGSFIKLDCGGFVEFNMVGSYAFPENQLVNLENEGEPVKVVFQMNTQEWGQFIGTISGMDKFAVAGAEDFPFEVGEGIIDFATTSNSPNVEFPEGYTNTEDDWQGFFIPNLSMSLPNAFANNGEPAKFTSKNLLIDNEGATTKVVGENVFNLSTGNLGSWGYSMDSVVVNFSKNELIDGKFGGGIQLPVMSGEEAMPYSGTFAPNDAGDDLNISFVAKPKVVDISLLRSKFSFEETSIITVGYQNGEFETPKVDLSGLLEVGFAQNTESFSAELTDILAEIEDFFAASGLSSLVPELSCEGILFEHFKIDMDAEDIFSISSLTPQATNITFLGQESDLSNMTFKEVTLPSTEAFAQFANNNAKNLGFEFETKIASDLLGGLAPTVRLKMIVQEELMASTGEVNYSFADYELTWEAPDVNFGCSSDLEPLVLSETPFAGSYAEETLKVGRFVMDELSLTSNSDGTLSGSGRIEVPVLGPMRYLDVAFTDISINANGEMIAGEILTQAESNGLATSEDLPALMNTAVNKLTSAAEELVQLPIVMGDPSTFALTIVGLSFGAQKASLQTRLIANIGNDEYVEFVAEGLNIVPDGIAEVDVRLGLGRAFDFSNLSDALPITFKPYDKDEDTGSYVTCDCDGFQSFNLDGEIAFSRDILQSKTLDENGEYKTVTADFSTSSATWGNFLGNVEVNDSVFIPGIEELPFNLSSVYIDLSKEEDFDVIEFPEGYTAAEGGAWEGVFIPNMSMSLPAILTETSDEEISTITGTNMVMDANGFTGVIEGFNLIDMETADIGGLGFGLDSFSVKLMNNNLLLGEMKGKLNMPLLEVGEGIPYRSFFSNKPDPNTGENFLDFLFMAQPAEVSVPLLSADFKFDANSSITMSRAGGEFTLPVFDMNGSFSFDTESGGVGGFGADVQQLIQDLNDIAGFNAAPEFSMDSIEFTGFKFDPNKEEDVFEIESITPRGVGLKFLEIDIDMNAVKFAEIGDLGVTIDSTAIAEGAERVLGLNFDMVADVPVFGELPLEFTVAISELKEVVNGINQWDYEFATFDFDYEFPDIDIPDFTCESGEEIEAPEDESPGTIAEGETVEVAGFKMKVTEFSGSSGKGVIRIPFMNYKMNVSFSDLEVNGEGQLIGGEIVTDTETTLISDEDAAATGASIPVIGDTPALQDFLSATQNFFTLPISIREKLIEVADLELPEGEGFDLIIIGMSFTPEGASMNMSISVPSFIEGDTLQFGIRGLNIRPDGIDMGQLKLFLAETIQF